MNRNEDSWLGLLVVSLLMFGSGGYFYWLLSDFEKHGGKLSLPWILTGLYNAFGKFGLVSLCALLGFYTAVLAWKKIKNRSQ